MQIQDLENFLAQYAHPSWQEEWDNCGFQIKGKHKDIKRVLLAMDIDKKTFEYAKEKQVDTIISHHPLFFSSLKSLNSDCIEEDIIIDLVRDDIHVYSMHTNLDKAPWGVNFALAQAISPQEQYQYDVLEAEESITIDKYPFINNSDFMKENLDIGLGHIISTSLDRLQLLEICQKLSLLQTQVNFTENKKIDKLICSGGSWDGDWNRLLEDKNFAAVVTGEMKYHDRLFLENRDIAVYCIGHDVSERLVLDTLAKSLKDYFANSDAEILVYSGHKYSNLIS